MKCSTCVEDGKESQIFCGPDTFYFQSECRTYNKKGRLLKRKVPSYRYIVEKRFCCSRNHAWVEFSVAEP